MELKEGNIMSEEKKNKSGFFKEIKASFQSRKFKQGAYATTLSAIVIVIIFVINLFAAKADVNFDMTPSGKYSLTEETINLLNGLNDDITIYYMVQSGQEIDEFSKIIDNFGKVNSHVSVVYKDPIQYPKFASQYVDDTIAEQSFIVVDETSNRAKYLAYADVIDYEYDYTSGGYNITGINIESKVDGAIQAITNEELPNLYVVTGHGETTTSTYMGTLLSEGNISHSELNTLTSEEIPDDCDILLINQPQYDYTEEETQLVLDYLKAGNQAIVCVDFTTPSLTNFKSILDYYGVTVTDGIVVETDSNYFRGRYATELVPNVISHDFTSDFYDSKYVVCPIASGLTIVEGLRDTITTKEILKTSDTAYSKIDVNSSTVDKEDGDIDGPFLLGVDVTETIDDKETRLIVYSGKYMWDDSYLATNSFANVDLLYNTINKMTGQENVITVRSISIDEEKLVLTDAQRNRNGLIFLAIIPLIFIIPGIGVVVSRRKK